MRADLVQSPWSGSAPRACVGGDGGSLSLWTAWLSCLVGLLGFGRFVECGGGPMAQQEPPVSEAAQPVQPEPAGRSRERLGSVLILTGVILLVLVAAGWGWLWWSQRDERAARAEADALAAAERQAVEHIHRWARAIVESRRTLDPSVLDGIYEPGSDFEREEHKDIQERQRFHSALEFTREIRSVQVKERARDRVVAVVVWDDSTVVHRDIRTGGTQREDPAKQWTAELEVRLLGDRWLVTDVLLLKTERLAGAASMAEQSAGNDGAAP